MSASPQGPVPAAARLGDLFARLHARELPLVIAACRLQRHRWLARLMLAATRAGDGWALAVLIPLGLLVDPVRGQVAVTAGVLSGLATAGVVQGLKALVRRHRPSGEGLRPPIGAPDRWAFPSGHSGHAFSILVVMTWLHPALGLLTLPLSTCIAASRVFFGLHYPSDVLVGSGIGASMAVGTLGALHALGWETAIIRLGPFG